MNNDPSNSDGRAHSPSAATSELNNLLEIISGTSIAIADLWDGSEGSRPYFEMLRTTVDRATQVSAQLVEYAGGSDKKVMFHPELDTYANRCDPTPPVTSPRKKKCQSLLIVVDEPMSVLLNK